MKNFWIISLLGILLFAGNPAAFANSSAAPNDASQTATQKAIAPKFITIPIYYVTDRESLDNTFGPRRRYNSHCQHHMYYGTAFITVPNKNRKIPDNKWIALGWQPSNKGAQDISTKDQIDPQDPDLSKKQFLDKLGKALDQNNSADLAVFVHGAADDFEDCAQDAASLAYSLQRPLVLYSWPSDPKRRGYFIDSSNIEWSQAHFNQFCTDLENFQKQHALNLIVVSHSMGNRLVIRAFPHVYANGLVKDWELISPDIDADICTHYLMGCRDVKGAVRLYVSRTDKLLSISQLLAGGYYRLGEVDDPLGDLTKANDDMIERIDFSVLDPGLIGHSIPCDLIANMVNTNGPGEGFSLVPELWVRGNGLSKYAGRSATLDGTTQESQLCKRVVRTQAQSK